MNEIVSQQIIATCYPISLLSIYAKKNHDRFIWEIQSDFSKIQSSEPRSVSM